MDHELEGRIGDLYTQPPEGFTASRNELGDALRAEGRREDEKRIRALRRPSVMAWAINVAARSHHELVEELLEAGRALRAEQQRALTGALAEVGWVADPAWRPSSRLAARMELEG